MTYARTGTISVDQFIDAPPAKVWRALTEPELHAKWWAPGDIAEHVGQVILGPFNTDRELALRSFRRLRGLEAEVVCFGHGQPLTGTATTLLQDAVVASTVPDPLA